MILDISFLDQKEKEWWSLYLYRCTALKELPNNLSVRGDLYLGGCTALKEIPKHWYWGAVEENGGA
jgi:hypothetical protein